MTSVAAAVCGLGSGACCGYKQAQKIEKDRVDERAAYSARLQKLIQAEEEVEMEKIFSTKKPKSTFPIVYHQQSVLNQSPVTDML